MCIRDSCYVPPNYSVARGKECLDYITNAVVEIKRRYTDPYIVVMGDFYQWDLGEAMGDFPELEETHSISTRGHRCIDRVFASFNNYVHM